jgi:hypothetical protein
MNVPVVLYCGAEDELADAQDVNWLRSQLPNVEGEITIPRFQHMDFIWGFKAAKSCYNDIIQRVFKV